MHDNLSPAMIRELLIRFSIESALIVVCLLVAYRWCGIRQMLWRLGATRTKVCFGFFVVFTVVQLADRWQYHFPAHVSFFPFARFAMYQTGQRSDFVDSYRLEGRFGKTYREINITEQFGAIGLPSINTRFRVISSKLRSADPADIEWAERQLEEYCESVAKILRARGHQIPDQLRFVVTRYDVNQDHCQHPEPLRTFTYEVS